MSEHFVASHRDELLGENRQLKERIKRLEEALDKTTKIASKHIKRLEEAGDAVAAIIGPPGSAHWADENQVDAAWNNWTKAKEAKL